MAEKGIDLEAFGKSISNLVPGLREGMAAFDSLTNGAQNLYNKFVENTNVVEGYRISLTKASGATSGFLEQIRQQTYALNQYGVSLNDVVNANNNMAESYSRATFSAAQTRKDFEDERVVMQRLITTNEKFGLSQTETINIANKLNNSIFSNVNQFEKFSDTLLKFSRETGQPFNKVMQEFGTYSDRFITAISSDKAIQSFTTLELLARRSGTSVSNLVTSISKFDDIDEAFSSGGQINRVLSYFGGSLDTMAMANASEEEAAKMILESITSISSQFNKQMTDPKAKRAVLKELVSATGLDLNTITGLLNQNNSLAKDMQSIIRTPMVTKMEDMSESQKAKMAMDLTSTREVAQIRDENFYIGPLTMAMERFSSNQKVIAVEMSRKVAEQVDKGFKALVSTGDVSGMLTSFSGAIKVATDAVTKTSGFQQFQAALGKDGLSGAAESVSTTIRNNMGALDSDKFQQNINSHVQKLHTIDSQRRDQDAVNIKTATTEGVIEGARRAKIEEKPREIKLVVRIVDEKGSEIKNASVEILTR